MTGEITLRGRVLPIGGLKEKTMAAFRSGVNTVLVPEDNRPDLTEIDPTALKNLKLLSLFLHMQTKVVDVISELICAGSRMNCVRPSRWLHRSPSHRRSIRCLRALTGKRHDSAEMHSLSVRRLIPRAFRGTAAPVSFLPAARMLASSLDHQFAGR